jgi:hypothetical protein
MGAGRGETRGAGKAAEAQAHGEELRREESLDPLSGWLHPYRDDPWSSTPIPSPWRVDGKPILIYKHAVKTIEEIPSSA